MEYAADLLDEIGLGRERVEMVNLSSAMGAQFADAVSRMTERIQGLGPSPLRNDMVDRQVRAKGADTTGSDGGQHDCR